MGNDTFGGRVRELRKSLGLTQDELANALAVTKGTVSVWERDGRKPDYNMLESISQFFNVNMGYLLCEDRTQQLTEPSFSDLEDEEEIRRIKTLAIKISQLSEKSLEIVEGTVNAAYRADQECGELQRKSYTFSLKVNV